MTARRRQIYTGIDLGTSTVKVVIAEILPDNSLHILSVGERPSIKMLKAEPCSRPEIVSESLRWALADALNEAGFKYIPGMLAVSLSGSYLQPCISVITSELGGNQLITNDLFVDVMRKTREDIELHASAERLTLIFNRCFHLADGRTSFFPQGQYSSKLDVETYWFKYDSNRFSTISSIINTAIDGRRVNFMLYAPVAIASAIVPSNMTYETLDLVIDIGAGMTSFAMPTSTGYLVCEQIAVGCDHVANDLSIGLSLDIETCRQMLRELTNLHCTTVATHDGNARMVTISHAGKENEARLIPADAIETIIEARLTEIFELIWRRLEELHALEWVANEVLLSGDGARLPRITELAGSVFNRKVKIATPYKVVGRADFVPSPRFNNVLGLIRACHRDMAIEDNAKQHRNAWDKSVNFCKNLWAMLTDW